jgi:hypothetical protein
VRMSQKHRQSSACAQSNSMIKASIHPPTSIAGKYNSHLVAL